jgi:hypothetical protein
MTDTNAAEFQPLNSNERELLAHVGMFGSAAYPVRKLGRGWEVFTFFRVGGSPIVYRTKRKAFEAFELTLSLLRARAAEEARARAVADIRRMHAEGMSVERLVTLYGSEVRELFA